MGANDRALDAKSEKRAARRANPAKDDGWRGFVALELTEAQKIGAKALREDAERLYDNVFGMIDDGYKLTFSYDSYNGAYVCSVTCRDKGSANNGLTLTARGGSTISAMASLWYKHDVVLARQWGNAVVQGGQRMREDDLG